MEARTQPSVYDRIYRCQRSGYLIAWLFGKIVCVNSVLLKKDHIQVLILKS